MYIKFYYTAKFDKYDRTIIKKENKLYDIVYLSKLDNRNDICKIIFFCLINNDL